MTTTTAPARPRSRCRPDCDLAPLDVRHLLGHRSGGPAPSVLPGLAAVGAATALSFGLAHVVPGLNPSTVAVVVGAAAANLGLHRPVLRAGTHVASHRLLRIAVVLLGLQLGLPQLRELGLGGLGVVVATVGVTFVGTQLLGRVLRVPRARALLVATGFSVCGASAIAAMSDVADGDEDDTAVAIALVTLCGSLAIVLLPLLRVPLGLDPTDFGRWVGASVHDVGQTVATADRVPGALTTAVVVKLSRVVLLAPLVAGVGLARRRRARLTTADGSRPAALRRAPVVPLFVVGFLLAIAVTSTGLLPGAVLTGAKHAQSVLLVAALAGLGTGIDLRTLRRTGGRSLVLGLASWALVAGTAYAGVLLLRH
ncbi:YeiH family protein [Microlunatus antarcticus]|uniref:Putative integral membrane protein (TIGR00698 family) n=1 Tax=Microlunatus antarcticus TaxID=53388 RepID=A0A7W5P5H5_9ACTN|nr:putative sulfate exporter family transporter [Microlunatus antarcticus]MBB3325282.1 putative integral membrane protein (TIGR00698 family) [Microlunatus antarcticus]